MWSLFRTLLAALVLIAFTGSAVVAYAQASPAAQQVLSRARAATGGAAWGQLRGVHEVGEENGVRFERWIDPLRYGIRTETHLKEGKFVQGYNGAGEWRILTDGRHTGSIDPPVLARIRTEAFLGGFAYFYPGRFDQRGSHLGSRKARGKTFDVVRISMEGGYPRELWFERKTGLLGIIVEQTGDQRVTTEFSDYRRAGPYRVPFKSMIISAAGARTRTLQSVEFKAPDRTLFSLPPPPRP